MNQYRAKAERVKRIIEEGRSVLDNLGQRYIGSVRQLLEKNKNKRITEIKKSIEKGKNV